MVESFDRAVSIECDRDDVDAPEALGILRVFGDVLIAKRNQPGRFPSIDRFFGRTKRVAMTRLHLDEDEFTAIQRDQIDLAATHPPFPLDDVPAKLHQATFGQTLTGIAERDTPVRHVVDPAG
jgi:hypothetical protein